MTPMTTTAQSKWKALAFSSALSAWAVAGCIAPGPQTPSAAPGSAASIGKTGGGSAPATAAAPPTKDCAPDALIDDGEDGNNQNLPVANRGGYWYTFVDKAGSTVTPMAGEQGGTFAMTDGGANGSHFAANFKGKIGNAAIVFGGMGMNFIDPKGQYDSSKYIGLAFYAKRGENSTGRVRLKVPDVSTDPEGGICSECFNDFGADLNLTTEWRRYVFPFRKMTQLAGWGAPRKAHIDPSKLYGVQFQVNVPGSNYDIWVDDLQFVCQ
jgi:endoglucanase